MADLRTTTELAPLRTDARWTQLLDAVRRYDTSFNEAVFNESLCDTLVRMAAEDQRARGAWGVDNRYALTAAKACRPAYTISRTDSLHYPVLQSIFRRHGYPDARMVGHRGSSAFWLLVQHQDNHPLFQDSVLGAMTARLPAGTVIKKDWAYLTDRVLVNLGKKQVYGTQFVIAPATPC